MSSPGGLRCGTSSSGSSFFSACGGGCSTQKNEMASLGSDGKSTPPGQQSICLKCNRNFRRSADAKPNSDAYERCGQCCRNNNGVGEWLQESCVIS